MDSMLASVQSHARIRGKAAQSFGDFATLDAGWQILLHLFSNPLAERDKLLSDLRARFGFPEATLNRCMRYAESEGFVLTTPLGGTNINLIDQARAKLEEVFAAA
jgi:hypothetical protein